MNTMMHAWLQTVVRTLGAVSLMVFGAAFVSNTSEAHPHVWVSVEATVAYENGRVKGITHRWTFDDLYTAMAIQGLDKDQDGKYTREELKELAQVNIDGLKEFDYFTYARLGEQDLALASPIDYWLEHKDGILALYFTLPLADPLLANAQGFNFQIYDPSYFIAFDLAEKEPIRLGAGAPAGCGVDISVPQSDIDQSQDLSDAFLSQFGGNFGITLAKTIAVKCAQT